MDEIEEEGKSFSPVSFHSVNQIFGPFRIRDEFRQRRHRNERGKKVFLSFSLFRWEDF